MKFLADHQAQTKLRHALEAAFPTAVAAARDPAIQEITGTNIPYLDATLEETLRCAVTAPAVDRVAVVDTELLGHWVPKGTVVTCFVTGPSMMSSGFDIDETWRSPTSQAAWKKGQVRAWDPADMGVFRPDRWIVHEKQGASLVPRPGPSWPLGSVLVGAMARGWCI
ncbi:cytochrome P450 monooxygenase [Penicillium canariense]|uniref:Cytochrome P450 monooxygenase n=1 Tax=Penicillium canariense TaxID=189055 RepID=A0A9W9LP26_9EURO|nr:cytochrome P450 monooxygenase [Penicillium canariense]KAJ5167590.1 cytochrome P450 monooxygenase [Penicillium canariense]